MSLGAWFGLDVGAHSRLLHRGVVLQLAAAGCGFGLRFLPAGWPSLSLGVPYRLLTLPGLRYAVLQLAVAVGFFQEHLMYDLHNLVIVLSV